MADYDYDAILRKLQGLNPAAVGAGGTVGIGGQSEGLYNPRPASTPVSTTGGPVGIGGQSEGVYSPGRVAAPSPLAGGFSLSGASTPTPAPVQTPNYQNVNDFDFDSTYQSGLDALQRQKAGYQSDIDLANQRDQETYDRSTRDLSQQQNKDVTSLNDRLAGQGILRSGISAQAQGDLGQQYQNEFSDLSRQRTENLSDRERSLSRYTQQIQDAISGLDQERTRRQQAKEQQRAEQAAQAQQQQQQALVASQPQMSPTGQYSPSTFSPSNFARLSQDQTIPLEEKLRLLSQMNIPVGTFGGTDQGNTPEGSHVNSGSWLNGRLVSGEALGPNGATQVGASLTPWEQAQMDQGNYLNNYGQIDQRAPAFWDPQGAGATGLPSPGDYTDITGANYTIQGGGMDQLSEAIRRRLGL